MEFGKVADLEQIDWSIPEDGPLLKRFLASCKQAFSVSSSDKMQIFFGAPAWGHPAWIGLIYPHGAKRSEFLFHYSRYFNCVELNTSHYRIPSHAQIGAWLEQVPEGFLFCPKVYQGISHGVNGLLDLQLLREWLISIEQMGSHLGPCFLQLPPHFDYSKRAELHGFLKSWPAEFPLAIELRHPSWFDNGEVIEALTLYLQDRSIGLVITDVAGRREVVHASISSDFALVRFVGNNLHATDFVRARTWSDRFASWSEQGLKKLFLFVHEPDDVSVPTMTDYFLKQLWQRGDWSFPSLPEMNPQLSLDL